MSERATSADRSENCQIVIKIERFAAIFGYYFCFFNLHYRLRHGTGPGCDTGPGTGPALALAFVLALTMVLVLTLAWGVANPNPSSFQGLAFKYCMRLGLRVQGSGFTV